LALPTGCQTEQGNLRNHQDTRRHQQIAAADNVRERPGGHFQQDDGPGPNGIQQGKLFQGQAEIEKQNRKDRIVETGIEANPKSNETAYIADGKGGRMDCRGRWFDGIVSIGNA
jgi:hypothetical protein